MRKVQYYWIPKTVATESIAVQNPSSENLWHTGEGLLSPNDGQVKSIRIKATPGIKVSFNAQDKYYTFPQDQAMGTFEVTSSYENGMLLGQLQILGSGTSVIDGKENGSFASEDKVEITIEFID